MAGSVRVVVEGGCPDWENDNRPAWPLLIVRGPRDGMGHVYCPARPMCSQALLVDECLHNAIDAITYLPEPALCLASLQELPLNAIPAAFF